MSIGEPLAQRAGISKTIVPCEDVLLLANQRLVSDDNSRTGNCYFLNLFYARNVKRTLFGSVRQASPDTQGKVLPDPQRNLPHWSYRVILPAGLDHL